MNALKHVGGRMPSDAARECRAFLCVRDERERLPHVLAYHRAIGVEWFCVVDNGSTDGTLEFLNEQPDCTVFVTDDSFRAANYGVEWINALVAEFGIGHWCLFIDADELLVYPQIERLGLKQFCQYLEREGAEGLYAFLLDMYSDCPIAEAVYTDGTPFLDVCPFFDAGYEFRNRPPIGGTPFPPVEVVGGPRLRRFYPEYRDAGYLRYALPRALGKLRHSGVGAKLRAAKFLPALPSPPLLSKVPLLLGAPGRGWVSNHKSTPLKLSATTGALLHFKFFADFHRRAMKALDEGQHFDGGSEYGRYNAALASDPKLSMFHRGSLRYRSSDQLAACGLLRTGPGYPAVEPGDAAPRIAPAPAAALAREPA